MITAVDTSVLIDVFAADPTFGEASRVALIACKRAGVLIAGEAVWAEVCSAFDNTDRAIEALETLGVEYVPSGREAAIQAGRTFRIYRARGGTRERVVADFLVGAHAQAHADSLLTRDRGFYRTYFHGLRVLNPASG